MEDLARTQSYTSGFGRHRHQLPVRLEVICQSRFCGLPDFRSSGVIVAESPNISKNFNRSMHCLF